MDKAYMDVVMQGKAIPGSSLASDPDNPAPYEKPPEYTNVHSASEWIFSELIEEDRYDQLINSLHEGIPVLDVTQVILFTGFTQGKWDVNLMTLLIEPVAYIIMALAERAGVDFVIERESPDDEDPVAFGAKITKERLERMENFKQMKMNCRLKIWQKQSQKKLKSLKNNQMKVFWHLHNKRVWDNGSGY